MASFIEKKVPELFTSAPVIWHCMYNNEIIEDSAFLAWYTARPSKRFEDPEKAKKLREMLAPFKTWIETAEIEPEPEEDVKEEEEKPEEKAEDKKDDINIDDI